MLTVWLIFILFIHFVADFYVQTRQQAVNKSKSLSALSRHVGTYTFCLALMALPYGVWGLVWALTNGLAHFVVDFFTSRQTAKYWNSGSPGKAFWVWLGFDQWLHAACLIALWQLFFA